VAAVARTRREERATEIAALGLAFRQVFRALIRLRGRDTHLPCGELSHAQYELLAELHERGELSAGQLAGAAHLAPATVTQMLEHLAASGHVERARPEHDRRVVISRLTAHGRRELEAKRERWRGRWEDALSGVDADDLRAATRVLTRLCAVFEADSRE
jgi:DNA-binding MarR family transcriptional regulator